MEKQLIETPPPEADLRPIPGYTGYFVGRDGSVWSHLVRFGAHGKPSWKRLKGVRGYRGQMIVTIRRDGDRKHSSKPSSRYIHHLVLEAFVGPRPEHTVCCHTNDDASDNRLENLRWDTLMGNSADAKRNGRVVKGRIPGIAKLTPEDVRIIRYLAKRGARNEAISLVFGVAFMTIYAVVAGKAWDTVE